MRTMRIAALLLVSAGLATGAVRSQSSDPGTASVSYFHEQLSPYGRWVAREGYGEVWVPHVAAGWRPYTTGHWVYTDQGWAWVADESWGWAPFHYGRWFYADGGWGWVPGTVWAPAWVAWRHGGGYVGWAALPPAVGFAVGVGVTFGGIDLNVAIAPSYYSFCGEGAILEPRLATVIVAPERNVTIINNTTNITNYTVVNNRVVNNGVSVQRIEQVTGHPVPRVSTASQVGLYQPAVLTRAARVTKAENFTNRPAGTGPLGGRYQPAISGATSGTGRRTTGTTGAGIATTGTGRRGTTGTTGAGIATTGTGAAGQKSTAARRHPATGTTGAAGTTTGTGRHRTTGTTGAAGTTGATTGTGRHHTTGTTGGAGTSTGTGHYRRSTGTTGSASTSTGTTGSHTHGQTSSAPTPHPPPSHRNTGAGTPPPPGGHPNTHAAPPPPPPHRQKSTGTGTGTG